MSATHLVTTVSTPNPDALMFRVQEVLIPMGTHEYLRESDTTRAPLARALIALSEVELVLIAPRFVTVRKHADATWDELEERVSETIADFIESGEMAVIEDDNPGSAARELSPIEQRIVELLNEEIRPAIAQDGGDVTFESFKDGVVYLRLVGSCGTCPSSVTTLKMGIERLLVEEIPEVERVENLDWMND